MTFRAVFVHALPLLLCTALVAQEAAPPARSAAPANPEAAAKRRAAMMARSGGIVMEPAAGPALLFLNTREPAAEPVIKTVTDVIANMLRLPVQVTTRQAADPLAEARQSLAGTNFAAVVVVANLPGQPALLIAPENRWALVNSAALGGPETAAPLRDERLRKELWRAFGYLMGAGHSAGNKCLMQSVFTPADLDALTAKALSFEHFGRMLAHAQAMGITPRRIASYRKAVEQGWASAPTNAAQQAIWNEVKAGGQATK